MKKVTRKVELIYNPIETQDEKESSTKASAGAAHDELVDSSKGLLGVLKNTISALGGNEPLVHLNEISTGENSHLFFCALNVVIPALDVDESEKVDEWSVSRNFRIQAQGRTKKEAMLHAARDLLQLMFPEARSADDLRKNCEELVRKKKKQKLKKRKRAKTASASEGNDHELL